jgi:hypothetical protein
MTLPEIGHRLYGTDGAALLAAGMIAIILVVVVGVLVLAQMAGGDVWE